MKIVTVVGARPQFIKCAPLSREIRQRHHEVLIHTGQHYDYEMDGLMFKELSIPIPDYNLHITTENRSWRIVDMQDGIERVLDAEKPDQVIVLGDTDSTLAGALAANAVGIPLVHVEAGLRSFDKTMPEEINRIQVDKRSQKLFCPTVAAVDNLRNEGITVGVAVTGDVMVDALEFNRKSAERSDILRQLRLPEKYLILTVHRQSNTDIESNLRNLVDTCLKMEERVAFPVHPRTAKFLREYGLYSKLAGKVTLTPPLGYIEFLHLMSHAHKILTDSGGIQKEAYILGVPCITLRDSTEWMETVHEGWNILVGTDKSKILDAVANFKPTGERRDIYGRDVSVKIVRELEN